MLFADAQILGRLYCRFADGSLEMQELGKLIRHQSYQDKNPFFLVREKGVHGKIESRELSPDIIGSMINHGKFPMRKMSIQLRNKLSDVEIYFFLNAGQQYSISGFPRCLFNDENDKASEFWIRLDEQERILTVTETLHPQAINTRRWAGRSNSRNYQRSLWTPPSRSKISRRETISHYSDPSHVMGHATLEQLKKTSEMLSRGNGSSSDVAYQRSTPVVTPGVWELDSKALSPPPRFELDADQTFGASMPSLRTQGSPSNAHLNQISHASNSSMSLASAVDSLYANPADEASGRTDSVINSPPPYVADRQPVFPGDTETEKAATRIHELGQPSPAVTPPPAYHNNIRHSEGYISCRPGPDVVKGDAARPRSEPHVLTSDLVQRQTETVVPEIQPTPTATILELTEEDTVDTSSIVPSPEIKPVERVPSLPHTLPPLDAFETVSFSITMDRSAHTGSPVSPSNASSSNSQWRWDIQF